MVEEIFNKIKDSFTQLTAKIDSLTTIVAEISSNVDDSMTQIANEIGELTQTLDVVLNITDLKNLKQSLNEIVTTFRERLEPEKVQNLIELLSETVRHVKKP